MKGEKTGFRLRKILNVGVVSCVITLFIYLTKLPIPIVIENAVDSVSGLAAPLSMMIIGDSLTKLINVLRLEQIASGGYTISIFECTTMHNMH